MDCPEEQRLQQLYEAAIRQWVQIEASSQLLGQPTHLTFEVKRRALADRNAAKARLTMHRQNCMKCRVP